MEPPYRYLDGEHHRIRCNNFFLVERWHPEAEPSIIRLRHGGHISRRTLFWSKYLNAPLAFESLVIGHHHDARQASVQTVKRFEL